MQSSFLFTFHYVSIKSQFWVNIKTRQRNLHSTMYLLNRTAYFLSQIHQYHLHSTMYLLNPVLDTIAGNALLNLHSTMYLLNLMGI